jgi:hypothetical protein
MGFPGLQTCSEDFLKYGNPQDVVGSYTFRRIFSIELRLFDMIAEICALFFHIHMGFLLWSLL